MEVHLFCNFRPWGARYKLSDYSSLRSSSSSHLLGQNELSLFFLFFSGVCEDAQGGARGNRHPVQQRALKPSHSAYNIMVEIGTSRRLMNHLRPPPPPALKIM